MANTKAKTNTVAPKATTKPVTVTTSEVKRENIIEKTVETVVEPEVVVAETIKETQAVKEQRKFMPGDMIECRCVRPNVVIFYSTKTDTRYEFGGYGDINEVDFADLQRLKASKSPVLYQPKILIEDPDLREQWAKELESVRAEYEGIYSTEDVFEKSNFEFEQFLRSASEGVKDLVKTAAVKLIKENVLTDLSKITLIDDIYGTKLKEFI